MSESRRSIAELYHRLEKQEQASGAVHSIVQQVVGQLEAVKHRMARVRHKIAVMSGKGGVGKSSVTVNLALALAKQGLKVGVLDVDISGPCIPKMLGVRDQKLTVTAAGAEPAVAHHGVKVASMDLLVPTSDSPVMWKGLWEDSAVWRGTVEMSVIRELISDVAWGELDYLLIDMPPASSDKPPVIAQLVPDLDGALIVTIPSEVAQFIVRKSVVFLNRELKIPILGLVENMSGAVCPHCGEGIELFEEPSDERRVESLGLPILGQVPFDRRIAVAADRGRSFLDDYGPTPAAQAFRALAQTVHDRIERSVA